MARPLRFAVLAALAVLATRATAGPPGAAAAPPVVTTSASPPAPTAAPAERLGKVDFPTSGSPAAQERFLHGLAALHSFWYDEAADAFREAQRIEPGFAMAYWGEAMTYNHPIWQEVDVEAARAALARLAATPEARAARAPTPREKGYLAAVETLYGEGDKAARDRAYAAAMARLAERFPEDVEAAAFQALSILGLTRPGDPADFPALMRAAAILEELLDQNPDHPGVLHYLIHAYDDPVHAPLGLRAARRYAQVAPAAHHALHMPSHIFVQLGMWPDVAASNEASWAASVAWTERRALPVEKRDFHSLGWLGYAYLQQGRYAKAREVIATAREAAGKAKGERVAAALAGLEARYAIETGQWQLAPALEMEEAEAKAAGGAAGQHACSAISYAHGAGQAVSLLANGLEAGLSGDAAGAARIAERLAQLGGTGKGGSEANAARVMEKEVSGLALLAGGKEAEGLARLAEAAALEEALPAPSGPPDLAKPALELYGEALLERGRPQEAAAQFAKALARMPNRSLALLGAARAAAKLGDEKGAREHYARLAENWRQADAGIAIVEEARSRAAVAPAR
jgi:tetratricopeptide (TPR) repeat protein